MDGFTVSKVLTKNMLLKPYYSVCSLIIKGNENKKVGLHSTYKEGKIMRQQVIFTLCVCVVKVTIISVIWHSLIFNFCYTKEKRYLIRGNQEMYKTIGRACILMFGNLFIILRFLTLKKIPGSSSTKTYLLALGLFINLILVDSHVYYVHMQMTVTCILIT